MSDKTSCPACGAGRCPAKPLLGSRDKPTPVGPCPACAWCRHTSEVCDYTAATGLCEKCNRPAVERRDWSAPEHLPRPANMGTEEFAFRASLFVVWKTRPASELASQFLVFADWLAEHRSAEEAAARAAWVPYVAESRDPLACRDWTVPVAAGWHEWRHEAEHGLYLHWCRFPTGHYHNARWFLCWPPGFVRFTAPFPDSGRWRVTTFARSLHTSGPLDVVGAFHPPRTTFALGVDGMLRVAEPNLGLFNEEATR